MADPTQGDRRLSLESEFNDYIAMTFAGVPIDATQYEETRRAFYVGAHSLLSLIMQGASVDAGAVTEDDDALMEGLLAELRVALTPTAAAPTPAIVPPAPITDRRDVEAAAARLGRVLKSRMPDQVDFILWLASRGPGGFTAYTSTITRESAIRVVEEWLRYLKAGGRF